MTSLLIIGVLMLLAMFIIGWFFAWFTTSNYYEQRIRQGEFPCKHEKEELWGESLFKEQGQIDRIRNIKFNNYLNKKYAKKQREEFGRGK